MVRQESPTQSGERAPDGPDDESGGTRDSAVNRRTLLQTMSVVGGLGLAGCAAVEDFTETDDDAEPSTTFGYGGTPTPTATSVATTVATTAAGSTTAPSTATRTTTETTTEAATTTPAGTTTPTRTTTETTTATPTTTPEDDFGEQGYGQYGYGGID